MARVTKITVPAIREVRKSPKTNPEIDLLTFPPISAYLVARSGDIMSRRPARIFGASTRSKMTNDKGRRQLGQDRNRTLAQGQGRFAQALREADDLR